jgi:glycerol kinase
MYVLAIDQGTTGTKVVAYRKDQKPAYIANREFPQYFPRPGWVEHDAEEIWEVTLEGVREVLEGGSIRPSEIAAVGITNQRETSVIWDRETGKPARKAIVWQCRRSADICRELKEKGYQDLFCRRTGLVLDPYFSGTKLSWVMEHEPEIAHRAEAGDLAFGTVDSWLLYRMTGGRCHATDVSNASRTLLFNIHDLSWDADLAGVLGVPPSMLPEVRDSSGIFGITDPASFLGIEAPVAGIAGDQQAALFGQACFQTGMTKNTYGTGSFVLMNIGEKPILSGKGLLTTVAWGIGGRVTYALEGSIFVTGAAINWLRDGLGIIQEAREIEPLARSVERSEGVFFVPAFVGLGAPYWDPSARALMIGMTRGTGRGHVARAVIESMALQTADVIELMAEETGIPIKELRVDGGASVMDLLLEYQADLLGVPVIRPVVKETTSLGAALLAGLAVGFWKNLDEIASTWEAERRAEPRPGRRHEMEELRRGWKKAVQRCLGWLEEGDR